jgi:hypothetical protein
VKPAQSLHLGTQVRAQKRTPRQDRTQGLTWYATWGQPREAVQGGTLLSCWVRVFKRGHPAGIVPARVPVRTVTTQRPDNREIGD